MDRRRLGIVFGGESGEDSVSVASGMIVAAAVDAGRWDGHLVYSTPAGQWRLLDGPDDVQDPDDPGKARAREGAGREVFPVPGAMELATADGGRIRLDVAFPVLHGPRGEDGTVQGVFELMGLPYVGADVLGSAVGMDKDVMKRLSRDSGLVVVPWLVVRGRHMSRDAEATHANVRAWCDKNGWPVFVKPANLGSSVGISRVTEADGLAAALEKAFEHDRKVIVERGIEGREIECAVLGGDEPDAAAILGEVVPRDDVFYSWEAKYIDARGADTIVPADVDPKLTARIRALAVRAFRILECWGMARADFLVETSTGTIFFNEINTIPGFTRISMYAKMWDASGLPYPRLVERLLDLAIERVRLKSAG